MDAETLRAHRDLWVPDPTPSGAALGGLTSLEADVRALLREEGDVRLEQERIPLATALGELEAALVTLLGAASSSSPEPQPPTGVTVVVGEQALSRHADDRRAR